MLDTVPAFSLTVNAHAADNAINYGPGLIDPTNDGRVAVDNFEPIEFSNKFGLNINGGAGTDTITTSITRAPDRPSRDRCRRRRPVRYPGTQRHRRCATNVAVQGPDAARLPAQTGPDLRNQRSLHHAEWSAGRDALTLTTVAFFDQVTLDPGTAIDSGSLSVTSTGVLVSAPSLSLSNLGRLGSLTLADGSGTRQDRFVDDGTASNDSFTVNSDDSVSLNSQIVVKTPGVSSLVLNGFAGNDVFNVTPTIASLPYLVNLNGGYSSTAPGDQATLTAAAVADLNVSGQEITQSGKTVAGSGLENINLNGAGNPLIYNGILGVKENVNVIAFQTANSGQVSAPEVAQWTSATCRSLKSTAIPPITTR